MVIVAATLVGVMCLIGVKKIITQNDKSAT